MQITIKWTAFETTLDGEFAVDLARKGKIGNAEMSFEVPTDHYELNGDDMVWLEYLFECTNLYQGAIWKSFLDGKMPEERSHTALSVGDEVVLDGRAYRCEFVGWKSIANQEQLV
jgi:hypothetical protein